MKKNMRALLFSGLLVFTTYLLVACPPPKTETEIVPFLGKDEYSKNADFVMAIMPTMSRKGGSNQILDGDLLSQEIISDTKIQEEFKNRQVKAIVAVGVENCNSNTYPQDADQIRIASFKQPLKLTKKLNVTDTGYQEFSGQYKAIENLTSCDGSSSQDESKVLIVGITELSQNMNIPKALEIGLKSDAVTNKIKNSSFSYVSYHPVKVTTSSFVQVGSDKSGKAIAFDFFILNNKAWIQDSSNQYGDINNDGQTQGTPIKQLVTYIQKETNLEPYIKSSAMAIAVGLASCEGDPKQNERLAENRANNLISDVLIPVDINIQKIQVILGQYKRDCLPDGTSRQRPLVIAAGNYVNDKTANFEEALYDALIKLQATKKLLNTTNIEDYTITDPKKVIRR